MIIDSGSKEKAVKYLCLGICIICLSHILEILSRNIYSKVECRALDGLRNAVIHQAMQRSIHEYEKQEDSYYISILTTDIRTLCDDYYKAIFNIVFFGGIMNCSLGMYAYISLWMLLVIICISVVPIVAPKFLNNRLRDTRKNFSEVMAGYTQTVKEILGGFETIHLFRVEKEYEKGHQEASITHDVNGKFMNQFDKIYKVENGVTSIDSSGVASA